jgi:UDP-2,3-diacylglucosamine hydrolase
LSAPKSSSPHTLFVSDLHLSAERPHINEQFFEFTGRIARGAETLYILGDLFEYWLGDDDLGDPLNAAVANALQSLSAGGVPVRLMRGNRDLLIGSAFARRCGAELIDDSRLIELYGVRTLVMHGDTLCTDDREYQKFRAHARDSGNQARFLAQPLAARREEMLGLRSRSEQSKRAKPAEIMDVSVRTVEETLREYRYPRLIHGHTHRPARHVHVIDGRECERWVLNDWYVRGGYLRCDAGGCAARSL